MKDTKLEPIWIECEVDCDEDYFHLNVIDIEGDKQGQEWDNSMKIKFIEESFYEALEEKLERYKKALEECRDVINDMHEKAQSLDLDGRVQIERINEILNGKV